MTRLLILVAIVIGVAWWLFGRKRPDPESRKPANGPKRRQGAAGKATPPAQIVACAHCGVHLPHDEAVADGQGKLFCGEDHRLAGPR